MEASIVVNAAYEISAIDPRIYGGFLEHLGRAVYEGVYEPEHPTADEDGLRQDVIDLVRELGMPMTRYPGGNFVSGYNWEDGVGPREQRPERLDLAWKALEPNLFGTDEFVKWCRKADTAPMMAVNLGTRGPAAAQALVEYCNHPGGSAWSDRRRANGSEEPHGIKLWCLGNEMDGPWQTCAKTADEYGRIANEAGKMMKWTDPTIELVVCGSSSPAMPDFAAWETTVLDHAFGIADYLSLHIYFNDHAGNRPLFLAQPERLSRFIEDAAACCDFVSARKKSGKRIMLSVDEWNVWYHSHGQGAKSEEWTAARPLLEDTYDMADVLVVGGTLNALLNHADRVKIACLAQTVNVIAPIRTETGGRAWRQTIFHPFALTSRYGRGTVLRQVVTSPSYDPKAPAADKLGHVPYLSSSVVWRREAGEIAVFAVNRSLDESLALDVRLEKLGVASVIEHLQIADPDLAAVNSADEERVKPTRIEGAVIRGETLSADLAPASWNLIRVQAAGPVA